MTNTRLFLSIILCLLIVNRSSAQMVGDCVFLKGKYVEVGIAPNGGYGSTLPAPANYHPFLNGTTFNFWDPAAGSATTSGNFLGFVADFGRDGWTTGVPGFFGDFYLPGTPQEGWAINVNGSESEAYIPAYNSFGTAVTGYTGTLAGTNLTYINSGSVSKGIWKGTQGALGIRQTTILDTNKLYFTVNVVLVNTGTTPLTNIYYLRTVDPDNEQTQTGDYSTNNTITYQLPNPGNKVLVSAVGTSPTFATNAYLGLGTKDCRAKCVIYDVGLDPGGISLPSIYNETTSFGYTQGFNQSDDVGIGLVYNIGTIAPGDSTSLTYAYILNAGYIDSALDATQPAFQVNTLSFNSGDTINLCTYNFDTVLVSMGSGSFYHWHWSPGTYLTDTAGVSNVIPADSINTTITYTITGVNVSGACDTVKYMLTFVHDTFNIVLANHDTGICIGQSIQALVTGPPLLTYTWLPTTGVSNPSIMNPVLTPVGNTTYTVTASSSSGCPPVSRHFTIGVSQLPVVTMDSAVVKTCVGVATDLHAYVNPGGVTYNYTWSPATALSNPAVSNPAVTPTGPGDVTYTVTVSPSALSGCIGTANVRVHAVGDFTINTPDAIICLGDSVIMNVTGSNEIKYTWTPATNVVSSTSMAPIIKPTAQGAYTYVATGAYAHCPDYTHVFHIRVDTMASPLNFIDTICLGMSASFDVTVPGGNATTNYYHYQWTPGMPEVSNDTIPYPVITPATVGVHTYIVAVHPLAANCQINDVVTVDVLPNVISVRPVDTAICLGQIVQAFGSGDPAFTYQWLPTTGIAVSTQLNTLLAPDTSVSYIVKASFHGCPDMYATSHIDVQPNPSLYIGGNRTLCEFDSLHINAHVTPAWYGGYTYAWTPAADLDNTSTATVVYTGTVSTNIILTVTTSARCTAQDSAKITIFNGNFASISPDASFCPHDGQVVTALPSSGVTYQWHPAMYVSDSTSNAPTITPLASQTYTVTATTANGCKDTVYWSATVYPGALISITDSVILYPGESYHIVPSSNCSSFLWFPSAGLDNPYISDPVATPDVSTIYIVQGTTENGCVAYDSIVVTRTDDAVVAMPNAFTPGTGSNNTLKILDKGIAQLNYFRVYNRWGNVVFETKSITEGWDGSWKGEPQPFGVYIYSIQAVSLTGKIVNKSGNVSLLR